MKHKTRIAALMLSLTLCIGAFAVPASALSEEAGSMVEEAEENEVISEESVSEPEAVPEEPTVEEAEPAPEAQPDPAVPEESSPEPAADNSLTPEGNLSLVDDYGSATGAGKQFITLVTKSGNYFYLIIDRDVDRNQTVHFLNQVDEADLLSLMDEKTAETYRNQEAETPTPTTEETPEEPEPTVTPVSTEQASAKPSSALPSLMLLGAVAVGGIVFALTGRKRKKATQQVRPDPDADYEIESGYEFPDENMDDA